jgi:hypothetical protein
MIVGGFFLYPGVVVKGKWLGGLALGAGRGW